MSDISEHEARAAELRRALGEEHPETLAAMLDLAERLWAEGRLGAARALEEQVVAARLKQLGEAHADTLKAELVQKPWQILEAPTGTEFVTSDNPVITFLKLREDLWHPGHGFRKPGVIVAFPLAPSACLTVGVAGREFQEVDAATVKRMNEMVVSCSDRFVYSKTRSQEIFDMVNTIK